MKSIKSIPPANKVHYTYRSTVKNSHVIDANKLNEISRIPPPPVVFKHKWDVVLIDGPTGFSQVRPGRILPFYWASKIIKQNPNVIIYVDDYNRVLEKKLSARFLGTKNIKNIQDNKFIKFRFN